MLTNEEKRVLIYSTARRPSVPSEVAPDTPLESLNLNWTERDLPERMRTKHVHRLHPYLGKFIPQLVEIFLRKYFKPGQTVLDPFVGSGTTLVQANELGNNAVGYDISQFNIILCRAKTARYELKKARKEVLDALGKAAAITQRELRNYLKRYSKVEFRAKIRLDWAFLQGFEIVSKTTQPLGEPFCLRHQPLVHR